MTDDDHITIGKPMVGAHEVAAVADAFNTGWVIGGPTVDEFEEAVADYVHADHAVAVANCTTGMQLVLEALGIGAGDRVLLPAQAFIADAIPIMRLGADLVFVDAVGGSNLMNVEEATDFIEHVDIDAVLAVHYAGLPAAVWDLEAACADFDVPLIEDAAQAFGADIGTRYMGTWGRAGVYSFGPLKMMTTGMGGMVVTDDAELAEDLRTRRQYGIDKEAKARDGDRPWRYDVPDLGHNWRMPDTAAAMGLAQLDRVDGFIADRNDAARWYDERLTQVDGIRVPPHVPGRVYNYYPIEVRRPFPLERNALAHRLMEHNIGVSVHWDPPLHQHQAVVDYLDHAVERPIAEQQARRLLTLPMHPDLDRADVDRVCDVIESA